LPHSRQHFFWREVINPQNGHILGDATSRSSGLSVANSLMNESVMEASLLLKRSRSQRKLGPIDLLYALLSVAAVPPQPASWSVVE
jgi:hypothetical protein